MTLHLSGKYSRTHVPCSSDKLDDGTVVILTHTDESAVYLGDFDLHQSSTSTVQLPAPRKKTGKETRGRKSIITMFDQILPILKEYVELHTVTADPRRRSTTNVLGGSHSNGAGDKAEQGFRLQDAQLHLCKSIPGLYENGFSIDTLHHLFSAPRKGTIQGAKFKGHIDARVAAKSNSYRDLTEGVHFGRAQQNLIQEFFAYHGQPNFSGDDMNIIQVGRTAVSRYIRSRDFFAGGKGYNNATHDFPCSRYGIKMGGFMLCGGNFKVDEASGSFESPI